MSTENIVKNKYYRILKDKTNSIWDRISFWTHADDVELTGGTTLSSDLTAKQTKIDATQSDFAQVETSPTTHAYTKGQMLIYNNQLYRVKAAIAVGNTLTVGTNIESVSVSTLSSMLTANDGKGFYFDVKDGSYGFYPTASKTSSEFVPFGGTSHNIAIGFANAVATVVDMDANEGHVRGFSDAGFTSMTVGGITYSFKLSNPSNLVLTIKIDRNGKLSTHKASTSGNNLVTENYTANTEVSYCYSAGDSNRTSCLVFTVE